MNVVEQNYFSLCDQCDKIVIKGVRPSCGYAFHGLHVSYGF